MSKNGAQGSSASNAVSELTRHAREITHVIERLDARDLTAADREALRALRHELVVLSNQATLGWPKLTLTDQRGAVGFGGQNSWLPRG